MKKYIITTSVFVFITGVVMKRLQRKGEKAKIKLGASFSVGYCRDLSLDYKETLRIFLNELQVRHLRLMGPWTDIEPNPGSYFFDDLDYQMNQANLRGAKVSLTLGLRQPHYPECHVPEWARKLSEAERAQPLLAFIEAVVIRYRNHPALESWQLENEALLKTFGQCTDYDRRRLFKELELVRRLDPNHPIIMTMSDNFGLPINGPWPDIYGFSLYRRFHRGHGYIDSPVPAFWYRFRARVIELIWKSPVIIHELQCEPWGPGGTQTLTRAEQDKSMDAERLLDHVTYAAATGIKHIDLWGGEWWVWRRENYGDDSLLSTAKRLYRNPELAKERF